MKNDSNITDQTINFLLDKYTNMFHDSFPLMFVPMKDTELIKTLLRCLEKHEPYKLKVPKDAIL